MIVAHFDIETLSGVRLSASPATEAMTWLRLAAHGGSHPVFGDPGAAARFALRDPDVAMVACVLGDPSKGLPDLLTPKPDRVPTDRILDAQLERMAATSAAVAAGQVPAGARDPRVRAAVDAGEFAARAANGMAKFWACALRDEWTGLRERLDADLDHRARVMAREGVAGVIESLHPDLRWTGSAMEIDLCLDMTVHYRRADVVLSPTLLTWPSFLVQLDNPDDAVLSYPARGVGTAPGKPPGAERLLGRTRLGLLRHLDVPRSTADLSERRGLARATVSYHLSVLHESGLVAKTRSHRCVLYRRTERGDSLL
ncbi:Helix-turn-helix domain-containing protein [Actinokineospora alba]|uniref:Helix-turn-helix domain-containing protein n=1 Tax=Actinokineospora alba TaxID=504798 RepID=A0A1H0RKW6_9PSEU|nr:helix-turn-helix domain-containing protein [Actinokineospora alba]TDP67031.1 helix-turn-helix protein [Actinokineospora alba]SDJ31223.1 Helix-turn-helix domain-containing protein [Actinokineospora alba]SDP30121.1 Helix-turn-helix domain-containing protein [Actinokineospora alba]